MRFQQSLIEGTLVRRDRKFVADVELTGGELISVHCANPGSLKGCIEPGSKVLLSTQDNPRLKLKHQLEIVYSGKTPVAVHAGRPATVVAEAIIAGKIQQLAGYAQLRRMSTVDRDARIDMVVEGNGLRRCYLRVETVTMADDGIAYFPDTAVPNGLEMLQKLITLVREGHRVMVLFLVQRSDAKSFALGDRWDGEYAQAFRDAMARGVEVACFGAKVTRKGIEFESELPADFGEPSK